MSASMLRVASERFRVYVAIDLLVRRLLGSKALAFQISFVLLLLRSVPTPGLPRAAAPVHHHEDMLTVAGLYHRGDEIRASLSKRFPKSRSWRNGKPTRSVLRFDRRSLRNPE